ncbi:MAG TPA: hypothetical protein VHF69_08320, partial [Candidatus Synoicihabitans sp.]|nr:hypothetical protein [Candidatus Synoicihabitans sp.]
AERPMLFIGPPNCEVAERVTRDRLGAAFAPDEIDAMADFVRQLVDDQEARGHLRAALRRTAMVQPGLATAVRFWARVVAQPGGSVLAADRR